MWGKRRVLLAIIFAITVAAMTVSLLEMQERLLSSHMVVKPKKTKFQLPTERTHRLVQPTEKASKYKLSKSEEDDDKNDDINDWKKLKEEKPKNKIRHNDVDSHDEDENEPAPTSHQVSKESDFEKSVNYDHKPDVTFKEEDFIMNIPHHPHEDAAKLRNLEADDKLSKTFHDDIIKLQDNDVQESDSILNFLEEAAQKKKTLNVEDVHEASNHHEVNDDATFIRDTQHVRNCVSGKILGDVPSDFVVEPYDIVLRSLRRLSADDKGSFREIYNQRKWGTNWDGVRMDNSSASGRGANIHWTQEVIATLHVIINQIKNVLNKDRISILDVPCGDMMWMSRFLETRDDIDYTGIDIVPELIAKHKAVFHDTSYRFKAANILEDGFNQPYDLVFNRMMLQHLHNSNVAKFLKLVSESGSHYLLTTTFPRHEVNEELEINDENPGRFRKLNLEVPPFSLVPPICIQHDGPQHDFVPIHHYISLWKLPLYRVSLCKDPWAMYLKGSKGLLYSCVQWGHRQP